MSKKYIAHSKYMTILHAHLLFNQKSPISTIVCHLCFVWCSSTKVPWAAVIKMCQNHPTSSVSSPLTLQLSYFYQNQSNVKVTNNMHLISRYSIVGYTINRHVNSNYLHRTIFSLSISHSFLYLSPSLLSPSLPPSLPPHPSPLPCLVYATHIDFSFYFCCSPLLCMRVTW